MGEQTETIKDSGERREFGTGAIRDMACKGRCDLLPWDVLYEHFNDYKAIISNGPITPQALLFCKNMANSVHHDDLVASITNCLGAFIDTAFGGYWSTAFLDCAFHYEAGAKKYADRNWEQGMPVDVYLDSAGRHFLKYIRGDDDERHDRAVVWNLLGALWTIKHHPDMIDAPIGGS